MRIKTFRIALVTALFWSGVVSIFGQTNLSSLKYGLQVAYGMPDFAKPGERGKIPASRFEPASVNVKAWARIARESGMTFALLTAKDWSGFCLWPAADGGYDVGHSPFKGDIVGDFVAACQAEGVLPGIYYSVADAHNDGAVRWKGPVSEVYFLFIKNQITELLTKYPGIGVMTFDGSTRFSAVQWDELRQIIQRLDPKCVILDPARPGATPCSTADTLVKGWFLPPVEPPERVHSAEGLTRLYFEAQKRGKAFLLNVGPWPSGNLPENQLAVLKQMKKLIANPPVAVKPVTASPAKADVATRLKEVKSLYDQGLINKDDYDRKVKEIMDSL
jgi:alpha-L-fucosidase